MSWTEEFTPNASIRLKEPYPNFVIKEYLDHVFSKTNKPVF